MLRLKRDVSFAIGHGDLAQRILTEVDGKQAGDRPAREFVDAMTALGSERSVGSEDQVRLWIADSNRET